MTLTRLELTVVGVSVSLFAVGCNDDPTVPEPTDASSQSSTVSTLQLPQESTRPWSEHTPEELFEYVASMDTTVIVGLTVPGKGRGVVNGRIVLTDEERLQATEAVGAVLGLRVMDEGPLLPAIRGHVTSPATLTALRASPFVDYVEPALLRPPPGAAPLAESGCVSSSSGGGWGAPVEYFEGDILPWNIKRMQVLDAWQRANGAGVTIGLVDTGVDYEQPEFNGAFSSGSSTGRSIWKDWSKASGLVLSGYPGWTDDCGHGTHMAGAMVAPKNGDNVIGVAWGANLASVRHHDDVWNATDGWYAAEGIRIAADRYLSKIIVLAFMSENDAFYVSDMIEHWYNQERLFVGAAGTSPCWQPYKNVVFPARISEVIAVTGLDHNDDMPCEVHRGSQIELMAYIEQPTTGAMLLGEPAVGGSGGTSNAAGVIAGIAALSWSRFPTASRDAIRQKLRRAMRGLHPYVDVVNAFAAVGGLTEVGIDGPALVETEKDTTVTYTAMWEAAPYVDFSWSTGATTRQISYFVPKPPPGGEYGYSISVTIADEFDGRTMTATKHVLVRNGYDDCLECF